MIGAQTGVCVVQHHDGNSCPHELGVNGPYSLKAGFDTGPAVLLSLVAPFMTDDDWQLIADYINTKA
jgi:hypothetical protein